MKIAFFGDSLTEGNFGVSYLDILKTKLPSHQLLNYGEGGDTVISLYHRIAVMENLEVADLTVLWIGVNDIFGRMNLIYRFINWMRKKQSASNPDEFMFYYRLIIELLLQRSNGTISIPPLFLGEDLSNKWNQRLKILGDEIRAFSDEIENVEFVNLREAFGNDLINIRSRSYLPGSILQFARDKSKCTTDEAVDLRSFERGLKFTLDGIHLNSKGAERVADFLQEMIERHKTNLGKSYPV
jgi:lysophospholipase L1-like esterase